MSQEIEEISSDQLLISYAELDPRQQKQRLKELALVFLKLGAIAFGGPAAHIAMMDDEVVKHRRWMSREKLLDLLGITNLIPGPNSTELAIHIGYERAGWRGLIIAGSCFILPAMGIVWILAAVYARYQAVPQVAWLLYGVKPVIIAIVIQALWKLGRAAIKEGWAAIAGAAVIVAFFWGINEILLLLLTGLGMALIKNLRRRHDSKLSGAFFLPGVLVQIGSSLASSSSTATSANWISIFLFFLKIGCVLYGSGYVLLAFLQRELVERNHWLTSQQLLDAIAIGQFTPGPVFTTATFIGYLLAGNLGAIAGTIGIFLPAFVLVILVNPWVSKLRQSPWASSFLDGVNVASWGLMAAVAYTLGRAAFVDTLTIAIAAISAVMILRFRVNAVWLILAGGLAGFVAQLV